jgi:hypothetical protein
MQDAIDRHPRLREAARCFGDWVIAALAALALSA